MKRAKWSYDKKAKKYRPKITEESVVKEIVTLLWLMAKIKVWRIRERIPGKGVLSTPGIPDLIGWVPGKPAKALFIEVKRPGGVHRAAQDRFISEAVQDGCVAFFAESWNDVVDNFKRWQIPLKN